VAVPFEKKKSALSQRGKKTKTRKKPLSEEEALQLCNTRKKKQLRTDKT
jgi:hypothetical protein